MTALAFFVQNNYVERLTAPVAVYARSHGICLEDRSSNKDFDPDNCGIDWSQYDLVLPYGSVQFVRQLKTSSLARFVLHDESRFATSAWVAEFGSDALNGAGRIAMVREVAELLRESPCHLRPDSVDKAFVGGVFGLDGWERIQVERDLDEDLACWVSPLQVIDKEWRCWVVGGRIELQYEWNEYDADDFAVHCMGHPETVIRCYQEHIEIEDQAMDPLTQQKMDRLINQPSTQLPAP